MTKKDQPKLSYQIQQTIALSEIRALCKQYRGVGLHKNVILK